MSEQHRGLAPISTTRHPARPSALDERPGPMNNLIVLPTVLPALTAAFLLLAVRYDLKRQRVISVAATAGLLAVAIILYGLARDSAPRPYRLGDWPAPFGIVLVLDRLSATMLVLAA